MRPRTVVLSLLFHAGLAASLLGAATHRLAHKPIAVALSETKKKEKPKPPKPPPVHPVARPPVEHKVASLPKSAPAGPVVSAAPRTAVSTALTMTNDDGPGGIVLPSRAPAAAAPTRVASAVTDARRQRMRDALGPGAGSADAPCSEEASRPEPVFKQEIEYTAQARAEGVEGKLKLRLTVAADGSVVKVEVIESVSPELDAAAIASAKQWRFKPAMDCGRATVGTYVLARRFELGD